MRRSEPMPGRRAYLDHNATAPVRPEVATACLAASGAGNPSSVHREGRDARALVEDARSRVAALVRGRSREIVFTSGGTEANATVLRPGALVTPDGRPVERLLVAATEHPSVLQGHGFPEGAVSVVAVEPSGLISLDALAAELSASERPALVSVQVANSETGILQPLRAVAAIVREAGAAWHADAVQAAGRVPVADGEIAPDAVTVSAHKLGGPTGIGALVVAEGRSGPALALLRGGGQERGFRAGTENVVGVAGFGIAAEIVARDAPGEAARLAALRAAGEAGIRSLAPDVVVFGADVPRLPNTLAFAIPGLRADTALMALDLAGVAVSSGSACSSGKVGRSHVLAAMGVAPTLAAGAIRVSFGWNSTSRDVAQFLDAFETLLHRLYNMERARAA